MKGDAEVSRKQYDLNSFDITSMESFKTLKGITIHFPKKPKYKKFTNNLLEMSFQVSMSSWYQPDSNSNSLKDSQTLRKTPIPGRFNSSILK